ncbi:hypothetical protein PAXRUDRAFT_10017 [Paxillus rubicundulus Ve08.2h10]|uniref:Uncharacterized protein n=1 Tax=Paxillus rubicundulus Ve08.2h10 TaxID=930991 RepID=A0A0D0E1I0_9AGAM|nr:hypothetical protein PAXRUDRAFT_10017 [Paxillus rubicundulus Ve08.2h10]
MPDNRIFFRHRQTIRGFSSRNVRHGFNKPYLPPPSLSLRMGSPQKYTPQSHIPPIVFPESFGSEEDASPGNHRGYSVHRASASSAEQTELLIFPTWMRLDQLSLRPGNSKRDESTQANVQQIVETKYDGDVDIDPLSSLNAA